MTASSEDWERVPGMHGDDPRRRIPYRTPVLALKTKEC